jgi:hypothetical protein
MSKAVCDIGLNREGKKACRTCVMGMLVSWHMDELNAKGYKAEASELEKAALDENNPPETICKLMETIQEKVDEPTKKRLDELNEVFDHHATQMEEEED